MTAILLIAATQAEMPDKGPQKFDENKSQQKQHKRQPLDIPPPPPPPPPPTQPTPPSQYQQPPHQTNGPRYVMKEVILYLTPTQIKALQTGQAGLKFKQPQSGSQPQKELLLRNLMQQQNTLQEEGQLLQREIEKMEADRKTRLQLQEAVAGAPKEQSNLDHLPQQQQEQRQQQEGDQQQHLQLQHQQLQQPLQQIPLEQLQQQLLPIEQLHQQHLSNIDLHYQPELLKQEQHLGLVPQLQQIPQLLPSHENQHYQPQFFTLPQIKPVGNENLQLLPAHQNGVQLLLLPEKQASLQLNEPNFKLVPYAYGAENELEAKKIFIANIENQLNAYRLHKAHQLEASAHHLEAEQLEAVTQLTAQQSRQHASEPYAHKFDLAAENDASKLKAQLEAHRLDAAREVDNHHFDSNHLIQNLDHSHHFEDADQTSSELQETHYLQQVHQIGDAEKLPEALPLIAGSKNHAIKSDLQFNIDDLKIDELPTLQEFETKQILEAQKLKQTVQSQEKEAERLDAQLEAEEAKVENLKDEQQRLQFFRVFVSNKDEFHSILNPIVQHHNILNILKEPEYFKSPELEKGFVPIEYTPKDNKEKYAKEIEQILLGSQKDKQKALAQAAAIASQPPVVIQEEIVKHVKIPIPAPYIVRVPEPFEVKVPQPYPVPLEIIRHVPYPVVKVEHVEVEKPVPFEVEKRVPVPVEKKVFIKVDRPYIVKRIVPVEVKKKAPIRLPNRTKNQKLTIIKHVWGH